MDSGGDGPSIRPVFDGAGMWRRLWRARAHRVQLEMTLYGAVKTRPKLTECF
jgi:hypothetical protein